MMTGNGLSGADSTEALDADIPSARRIRDLEAALQRSGATVQTLQSTLQRIYDSHGWRLLTRYYHWRNLLLPSGSRRRAGAVALLGKGKKLMQAFCLGSRHRAAVEAHESYQRWIAANEPGPEEVLAQRQHRFAFEPIISLLVPAHNTPLPYLKAMIDSVLAQTYGKWQLCLVDGNSSSLEVRRLMEVYPSQDERIELTLLSANRGIAGNSTAALDKAAGSFVALLDHDDVLAPFALFEVVRALNDNPEADFLYSDEDHLDETGQRLHPHFKPDWSPDLLCSHNYICHLMVLHRDLLERAGGFRPGFEGSQDHDLALRASEQARRIVHIPRILYHWRIHPASFSGGEKRALASEAGRRAVAEHLQRRSISASVVHGIAPGTYQVLRELPREPVISILIPTCDQQPVLARCLEGIAQASYRRYEVLLVENHSRQPETFAYYRQLASWPQVRLLTWSRPFNYAAVNNWAAAQARGEVLLLLNNDTQARNPDWLERMLEHALRPEVGAVGAKLYYPDGAIQHGGVLLGTEGEISHLHCHWPGGSVGYLHRLVSIQNVSAVTGACLMIRRQVFEEMGGLDERFALAYSDVDLCLRLRQRGYWITWTPFAELYHPELVTRGTDDTPAKQDRLAAEVGHYRSRWADVLRRGDPFFTPNVKVSEQGSCLRAWGLPEATG